MALNNCSLWGELPPSAASAVSLTAAEKEVLCRLSRPLALKGPKIYQPKATVTNSADSTMNGGAANGMVIGSTGSSTLQPPRRQKPPRSESILARCVRIRQAMDGRGTYEPGQVESVALATALMPITLARTGPFGASVLDAHECANDDSECFEPKVDRDIKPSKLGERDSPLSPKSRRLVARLTSPAPSLAPEEADARLRRSCAEVLAAVGYSSASERALQVMADVTTDSLRALCRSLRSAIERSADGKGSGFADPLERALTECHLASAAGIKRYVEEELLGLHSSLIKRYHTHAATVPSPLASSSVLTTGPPSSAPQMYHLISSGEDVPEIHFPSSEEGELMSLDHATPQLETGLQMLQSLEQGSLGSQQPTAPTSISGQEEEGPMSHDSNTTASYQLPSPAATAVPVQLSDGKRRKRN